VELLLPHRRHHLIRRAVEVRLGLHAALGGERRAGGLLLSCGFCWHAIPLICP
jgi:hypothetical protein